MWGKKKKRERGLRKKKIGLGKKNKSYLKQKEVKRENRWGILTFIIPIILFVYATRATSLARHYNSWSTNPTVVSSRASGLVMFQALDMKLFPRKEDMALLSTSLFLLPNFPTLAFQEKLDASTLEVKVLMMIPRTHHHVFHSPHVLYSPFLQKW